MYNDSYVEFLLGLDRQSFLCNLVRDRGTLIVPETRISITIESDLVLSDSFLQDVLEFIENSPHGVIYFTFGSVVSMSSFPETVQKAFVEALGRVPQRVLWKYEGEMKDKPKNVMTRKWFPQRDILSKAFDFFLPYLMWSTPFVGW